MIINKVTPTVFAITDVFTNSTLQNILNMFVNYASWDHVDWTGHGHHRYSTPYTTHLNEIKTELTEVETVIKEQVRKDIVNNGAVLWCDLPGFTIPMHYDQSQHLKVSFQIYLGEGPAAIGTTVQTPSGIVTVPYVCNTGYLIFYPTKQLHGVLEEVPQGITRKSLHTSWRFATDDYSWGNSNPYYDR